MAAQSPRPSIWIWLMCWQESSRFYVVVSSRLFPGVEYLSRVTDFHENETKIKETKLWHLMVRPGLEMGDVATNRPRLHLVTVGHPRLRHRIVAQSS